MKRIMIIDAGLGGLSIHAMLDKVLRKKEICTRTELIFFNVMPASGKRYNHMSKEERVLTFDKMFSVLVQFDPDLVLIACNTLSILYPYTQTSRHIKIPVAGIVDLGVKMILDYVEEREDSTILILGTPVTIASKAHEEKLVSEGINKNRIISQGCKDLDFEIPKGNNAVMRKMIDKYLREANGKLKIQSDNIVLVLCCTHYQFAKSIFRKVAQDIFEANIVILNPNEAMPKVVHLEQKRDCMENAGLINQVYSHMRISDREIFNIGTAVHEDAPAVYQALKNYCVLPTDHEGS